MKDIIILFILLALLIGSMVFVFNAVSDYQVNTCKDKGGSVVRIFVYNVGCVY